MRNLIVIALEGPTLSGEPVKHSHVSSYIIRERAYFGFLHLDTALVHKRKYDQ
jgi:hypothetical protein